MPFEDLVLEREIRTYNLPTVRVVLTVPVNRRNGYKTGTAFLEAASGSNADQYPINTCNAIKINVYPNAQNATDALMTALTADGYLNCRPKATPKQFWRMGTKTVMGENCPKCSGAIVYRVGRYGVFGGCANFRKTGCDGKVTPGKVTSSTIVPPSRQTAPSPGSSTTTIPMINIPINTPTASNPTSESEESTTKPEVVEVVEEKVEIEEDPSFGLVVVDETIKIAQKLVEKGRAILLEGPPGTGKSTTARYIAKKLGRKFYACPPGSEGLSVEALVGGQGIDPNTKQIVPVYGPLALAASSGGITLADEVNNWPPQVWGITQALLESPPKSLVIPEPYTIVNVEPGFCLIATCNDKGLGDDVGRYTGGHVMNAAQIDRFAVLRVDYLPDIAEKKLLKKANPGLKATEINKMIALAKKTREGDSAADLTFALGHRTMVRWAESVAYLGMGVSFMVNIANKGDYGTRSKLIEIYQRIFNERPDEVKV